MGFGDRYTKTIPVKIKNKTEMERKKDELVEVDREIQSISAAKAVAVADFNQDLKVQREKQRKLLDVIRDGEDSIDVEVFDRPNYRLGKVETLRADTEDVVDERPLTAEERQTTIGDAVAKKATKPKAAKGKRGNSHPEPAE